MISMVCTLVRRAVLGGMVFTFFGACAQDLRPIEFEGADAELNASYRKLMGQLKPEERQKLKLAQQAWLKLLHADCKWAFSANSLDCRIDRTMNRTKELHGTLFTRIADFQDADAELNVIYQKVMDQLRPADRQNLKTAQRAWLKFRDADCEWAFPVRPVDCLIDRTLDRTKELEGTLFEATDGRYRTVSK